MHLDPKRIIIICVTLVFTGTVWYLTSQKNQASQELYNSLSEQVSFNLEKATEDTSIAETAWQDTLGFLQADKTKEAIASFSKGRRAVSFYFDNGLSRNNLASGQNLETWRANWDSKLLEAAEETLLRMVDACKTGKVSVQELRGFTRSFASYHPLKSLEDIYDQELQAIGKARAKLAPNWMRIYITDTSRDSKFEEIVRKLLLDRWDTNSPHKLVYGMPADRIERQATWKTLTVKIDVKEASYVAEKDAWAWSIPSIPYQSKISFKIEGNPEIPSSWDSLPVFESSAEAPETLYVEKDGDNFEIHQKARENLAAMQQDIERQFQAVGKFQLFPGVSPENLQIFSDGKFDRNSALALASLSPERLKQQLVDTLEKNRKDVKLIAEIVGLIIEFDLGSPLTEEVNSALRLDPAIVDSALKRLKDRVWFDNYKSILEIAKTGNAGQRQKALSYLYGHLDQKVVLEALESIINDPQDPQRMQTASAFLRQIPVHQLKKFAHWIQDPDANFAGQVHLQIANRDKQLGSELALKHFQKASPSFQQRLLASFKFSSDGKSIPQEEVDFIYEIASSSKEEKLRSKALEKLRSEAQEPNVWKCLFKLKDDSSISENERELILTTLIPRAPNANPDNAANFLRTIISEEQQRYAKDPKNFELKTVKGFKRPTQQIALTSLLRKTDKPSERAESVTFLHTLTNQNPEDEQLKYLAVWALQQCYASKPFDWSQEEFVALVKMAMKSDLPQARFFACKIAGDANKKTTVPELKDLLETAKTSDPHPEIRQFAEARLNGKNHFVNPSKL